MQTTFMNRPALCYEPKSKGEETPALMRLPSQSSGGRLYLVEAPCLHLHRCNISNRKIYPRRFRKLEPQSGYFLKAMTMELRLRYSDLHHR